MLTKNEAEIIEIFRKDIFRTYTIRELMKKTGRKTYPWTFSVAKKLAKNDVIKMETKGKSRICGINLYNHLAVLYLSLLDRLGTDLRHVPHLDELVALVPTPFFTFLIGGSYAEGKQKAESDLDICVIVDDSAETKTICNILERKGELMVPEVHPFVFRKSEFLEMLLNKEANYGKMLFKKHLIASGAESYYFMIREAIERGFRG